MIKLKNDFLFQIEDMPVVCAKCKYYERNELGMWKNEEHLCNKKVKHLNQYSGLIEEYEIRYCKNGNYDGNCPYWVK